MIDFTQIGTTVEKPYRPYLWIGEEHDAHVVDFRDNQDVRFGNVGAVKERVALMALRQQQMALASMQHESSMSLGGQAYANQLAMMQNTAQPSFWQGMMHGAFPHIR